MNTYQELLDKIEKHGITHQEVIHFVKTMGMNIHRDCTQYYKDHKDYYYLLTFTIDPKRHPNLNDFTFQDEVQQYISKLVKSIGRNIYISKEHDFTNVHWHVSLITSKPIVHSKLRYYKNIYGNIDVSRSKKQTQEYSINYISKDTEPTKLD